jgi:hypothetical protein
MVETSMKQVLRCAGLAVLMSVAAGQAVAQEKIKVGVIVTLSGPAAVLGQQALRSRSRISAARWPAAMSKSWSSMTNSSPISP